MSLIAPNIIMFRMHRQSGTYWVLSVDGEIRAIADDRETVAAKAETVRRRWADSDGARA